MSTETSYKKLLLTGSFLSFLGSLALIISLIILVAEEKFASTDFIFQLLAVVLAFAIFISSGITILGVATKYGLQINDERPNLVTLTLFIFAPVNIISSYATPMYFLLTTGNEFLNTATTISFGFYLEFIGIGLILIAFIINALIFLSKNRLTAASGLNLGSSQIGFVKVIRIITNLLVITASVGIILGIVLPVYNDVVTPSSFLMYEDGTHIDLGVLAFLILIAGILVVSILSLLSAFGVKKITISEMPVIAFVSLLLFLPGFAPKNTIFHTWTSPVLETLFFVRDKVIGAGKSLNAMGWILLIGVLLLALTFFMGVLSYFVNKSATISPKPEGAPSGRLEAKKKRGKFPTGPPSAAMGETAGPPVGGLASQLSARTPGSPPIATSGPPSPPSFLPSAQPSQTYDQPTCPFCGKNLRFIDEYQRWYCDSCAQYV